MCDPYGLEWVTLCRIGRLFYDDSGKDIIGLNIGGKDSKYAYLSLLAIIKSLIRVP